MRTLILMRHAKAESGVADHARRLSERGVAEASSAGAALAALAPPDLVLLSDSARTVGTFERVVEHLAPGLPHRATRRLYGAAPSAILREIGAVADDIRRLLVIGHNPGIGDLARRLAGPGRAGEAARAELAAHVPTSCFVVIALDAAPWSRIDEPGRLEALWWPRGEDRP